MREQLIACLKDEVAPEIKRLRDPEKAILKIAHQRNFAPAQVEALGQLFNTVKTLKFLEKSASRGDSFPLVDVEQMVAKYLEPQEKSARQRPGISQYDQLIDDPATGLPACFASAGPSALKYELDTVTEERPVTVKFAYANERYKKVEVELVEGIRADFIDKAREEMQKIASTLKTNPDYSFTDLEQDVLFVCGNPFKPLMDKLARYLAAERIAVKRADGAGPDRLFHDRVGVMDKVARLDQCLAMAEAADDFIKEATAVATKPKTEVDVATDTKPPAHAGGKSRSAAPVKKKEPAPSGDFFGSIIGAGQKAYAPVQELLGKAKSVAGDPMGGQKQLDQADLDVHHLALLQDLMTTDDVLAEADPDKVVSMYNSIRENSPELAKDKNVMRVALRSAVAHDGISPFDIKTFSDTEQAKQKVHFNQDLANQVRYNGRELSPPNRPQ